MPVQINGNEQCPICRVHYRDAKALPNDSFRVVCELCGEYEITRTAAVSIVGQSGEPHPFLACHTRQSWVLHRQRAEIKSRNWIELAEAHRHTSIRQKLDQLLRLVEERTAGLGKSVVLDKYDHFLLDMTDGSELRYMVKHAASMGYIETYQNPEKVTLTVKGWEHVDPSSAGAGVPGTVFVAMSFDPSLGEAYQKGIHPALEVDCRLTAIRVDKTQHDEKICDKIIAEIRRCQFVVADFTLQNQGAYFEAGFAMGIGRKVIWSCSEPEVTEKKLHFDTRQYPHIAWKDPEHLRAALAERIKALGLARA